MCRRIMLTWSETCSTLARPSTLPVFDLLPRSYHDSMPGSSALKPLRRSRLTCGSESSERLLSATKSIDPGGAAASIASSTSSNRTPKLGSCQPTRGRRSCCRRNLRSSCSTCMSSGWYGTTESMQKLQVYGQPRLPSIGTILNNGALRNVGSVNAPMKTRSTSAGNSLEILEPGVTDERDVVALGFAPYADDLRHDARQVGVHHASIQGPGWPFGYEVDDADAELTHTPARSG